MRVLVMLSLALASCAYKAPEVTQVIEPPEPKPALRSQVVPGMTYGNATLQKETVDAAFGVIAAKAEQQDCTHERMQVSDTWPLGIPETSEYSEAFLRWKELWTIEVCGNSVEIAVVYMLHKETGTIDVRVSQLREGQTLELS